MSTESVPEEVESEEAERQFAYFNYRVMLTDKGEYEIRDVYYDANGEVNGWGSQANAHVGVDLEDLALGISYAVSAMAKPLLIESELSGYLAPEDGSTPAERDEVAVDGARELSAHVMSSCEPRTIGDVETWIGDLERFGLSDETELLDGAQVHPEGRRSLLEYVGYPELTRSISLGDLKAWVTHLYAEGLVAETALLDAQGLGIDLPVSKVSAIACGNCELFDVVVDVHEHTGTPGA